MRTHSGSTRAGFSLVELLAAVAVVGVLAALLLPAVGKARTAAKSAQSLSQIRQLALANHTYALEHGGRFAPASSPDNLRRWHGARVSTSAPFDPTRGFLSPYLGKDNRVHRCPVFDHLVGTRPAFSELGSGGYGYNAVYIGGTPADPFSGAQRDRVRNPARTVMFASTAFAVPGGLQEYPFAEPYQGVSPAGVPIYPLQPSVHFRHNGRAHIAWVDGHVSAELQNSRTGPNYYGGSNAAAAIGWFGPEDGNGLWDTARP